MNINALSGAFALGNIISKATGGKTLRLWKDKGYYPSQWGHTSKNMESEKVNIGGIFFDAVFTTNTEHSLTITQHPVQTGANLSDHAFVNPIRISMEIGVSDVMAYRKADNYTEQGPTKSISAYRTLRKKMEERTPIKVITRLQTYENMLIESLSINDDVSTQYALRANIELVQVLAAAVGVGQLDKNSARAWSTGTDGKPNNVQGTPEPESNMASIKGDGGHWNPEKGGVAP